MAHNAGETGGGLENYEGRLSKLESQLSGLTSDVSDLVGSVKELSKSVETHGALISQSGKWDAKTLLTMVGLGMVPLAAVWGLAIKPMEERLHRMEISMQEQSRLSVQMIEQFAQLETTYRLNYGSLEGRMSEMWAHTFQREMPRTVQRQVGERPR